MGCARYKSSHQFEDEVHQLEALGRERYRGAIGVPSNSSGCINGTGDRSKVLEMSKAEHPEIGSKALRTCPEAKVRQCLMCREEFVSAWAGERLCRRCKAKSNWREGANPMLD